MSRILSLFALALLLASCQRGTSVEGSCEADRDCPAGLHCIRGSGVCVRFLTPLEAEAGSPTDAAPADLATQDAAPPLDGTTD